MGNHITSNKAQQDSKEIAVVNTTGSPIILFYENRITATKTYCSTHVFTQDYLCSLEHNRFRQYNNLLFASVAYLQLQ